MLGEEQIAALYQAHGHAVFACCLRLAQTKTAAQELLLAAYCEFAKKRVRLSPFDSLCKLAAEMAGKPGATPNDDEVLFARYLADDLSQGQRGDLEERLKATPALQVKLAVVRSERAAFYSSVSPSDFAQRVMTVLASRGVGDVDEAPAEKRGRGGVAAFVAVAVVLAAGVYVMQTRKTTLPEATQATNDAPPTPAIAPAPAASQPVAVDQPASSPVAQAPETQIAPAPEKPPPANVPETPPAPAKPPEPTAAVTKPSAPAHPASVPTTDAARMMATFDFGESLGRVSIYEARKKQKAVPSGTSLQVRANIPEPGYVALLAFDPESQTVKALTASLKVEPRWHVLGRYTVEQAQRLYVVFSTEQLAVNGLVASATKALKADPNGALEEERYARIDLTIEAAP